MNVYLTEFKAWCRVTNQPKVFVGQRIHAPTWELAEEVCKLHYSYLKIVGRLLYEESADEDSNSSPINWNFPLN